MSVSSILSDDEGNIFAAYEVKKDNGGTSARLQKLNSDGSIVWDRVLLEGDKSAGVLNITKDGDGGLFAALEVHAPENDQDEVYYFDRVELTKVDAEGDIEFHKELTESRRQMQMVSSAKGGVILASSDFIISKDERGEKLWTYELESEAEYYQLAAGESGESFLLRNNSGEFYLEAHKLSPEGEPLWNEAPGKGVHVDHIETELLLEPQISYDGEGGAFISWAELPEEEPLFSVRVARINDEGEIIADDLARNLPKPVNFYTRLAIKNSGQAVVAWEDRRSETGIYAQKVDTENETKWQENGVPVYIPDTPRSPSFEVVGADNGGIVVASIDGDRNLHLQKLDGSGEKQWGEKGMIISDNACKLTPYLLKDRDSNFIVGWSSGSDFHYPEKSHLQKIDAEGNLLWEEKITIKSSESSK